MKNLSLVLNGNFSYIVPILFPRRQFIFFLRWNIFSFYFNVMNHYRLWSFFTKKKLQQKKLYTKHLTKLFQKSKMNATKVLSSISFLIKNQEIRSFVHQNAFWWGENLYLINGEYFLYENRVILVIKLNNIKWLWSLKYILMIRAKEGFSPLTNQNVFW